MRIPTKSEVIKATQQYTQKPKSFVWIPLAILSVVTLAVFLYATDITPEIRFSLLLIVVVIGFSFIFRNANANSNSQAKQEIIKKLSLLYQKEYKWGQSQALAQADIDFTRNGAEQTIDYLISKKMWK